MRNERVLFGPKMPLPNSLTRSMARIILKEDTFCLEGRIRKGYPVMLEVYNHHEGK